MDLSYLQKQVRFAFNKLGYDIRRLPSRTGLQAGDPAHGFIHTLATYSPWLDDQEFIRLHRIVKEYTMVDLLRIYELWQLVAETKYVPGSLIEVGVWRGGAGTLMASRAAMMGIDAPVYLCDTFTGVVKVTEKDNFYHGGEHADTSVGIVESLIQKLNLSNVRILEGVFPDESAERIPVGEKFRFCHIDVDVYQSAKDIQDWIWEKMSAGGIIVYDDYGSDLCRGITELVNDQRASNDRIVVHNVNGHGIIIKTG
jgi:O-methyltransferase